MSSSIELMFSKKAVFFFILLLYPTLFQAQSYFQQDVNYTINVKLNDVKHELNAFEIISYKNNSPAPLSFIYMHLWPNAYKDNNTPLAKQLLEDGSKIMYYAKADDLGYIDSIDFKVNDKTARWELLKDSIDICKIYLNEELKPGATISISTPFHVKIPSAKISRLGHLDQSYMITQWYPKPAVYDRNGWNYMPYLNQGEFYSEFGSYDVSITLPANYVLGSTGDMVDGEKELVWLSNKATETDTVKQFDRKDMEFPKSDSVTKTLRFKQNNIHDFAWFADKRYHVLKGEVTTPHTNHKVTTWAMFTNNEADLWKKSIDYINDAIHYYSLWNGDYPYNNCTAVDGTISAGTGMEYPNITVIGNSGSPFELDVVITHEVGHNWFYGMLGSNERLHPWMDEGINSYNENRYIKTKYPDMSLAEGLGAKKIEKLLHLKRYKHKSEYELGYLITARKNEDQPIELPAYDYTEYNYGADVYYKSAIVFDYLQAYLGETEMDKAMQTYFDEWHFKHPMPADFRKVMEKSAGKDLSWFFDDMINSTKKLDYKICSTKKNADGTWNVEIKNTGNIKGPVFLQAIKDDKVVNEKIYDGFDGKQTLTFPAADVSSFKIDYQENMPEINRNNNTIRTKGLFKKVEPLQLQFLASLDNPDRTQLFFTPVVGWNEYDKGMVGLAFYNNILPQKNLEFQLMPMYSFAQKDLAGYGKVMYNLFPQNFIQKISFGGTATRYDYSNNPFNMDFNKLAPELNLVFKNKRERSQYTHSLRYRYINISQEYYTGNYDFTPPVYGRTTLYFYYNDITYKLKRYDPINPVDASLNYQQGKGFMKTSITANYSNNYKNKNKSFDVRFFAGTFIGDMKNSATQDYRFQMSGIRGYNGNNILYGDYLYDNIFLGRSETKGILSQQFVEADGGFKFYSPIIGRSSKWIVALNMKSSLGSAKIPINLYADFGTAANDDIGNGKLLYDAGVCISLPKKIFEIYFPILLCQDFKDFKTLNDIKYEETIRFTLNINLMNPFDLINNFKL